MMTQTEARQRLNVHRMTLRRTAAGDYRVAFADRSDNEASAYYTDDLDDAVLTGALMRNPRPKSVLQPDRMQTKANHVQS
jgi:hypothetical protein